MLGLCESLLNMAGLLCSTDRLHIEPKFDLLCSVVRLGE